MNTVILIIILLVKKAINADYSALAEVVETNPQASKFKFMYKNIFSKSHTKNWSKKYW